MEAAEDAHVATVASVTPVFVKLSPILSFLSYLLCCDYHVYGVFSQSAVQLC